MGTAQISFNRYKKMADAIKATGQPMVFSLCNWGEDYVHTWGMSLAHSWRISGDIYDSFSRPDDLCSCTTTADPWCVAPGTHCSVLFILNRVAPFSDRSQLSGYNDLDMLEVGQGGMTDAEYKAHFAMWAALKSPLMLGNDVRVISPEALSILNNPAIIALSQDPLAQSAARVRRDVGLTPDEFGAAEAHVWAGPLANGDQVVIFLNAAGEDIEMAATLDEIFVGQGPGGAAWQTKCPWAVHDLWANRMDLATAQKLLEAKTDEEGLRILQDAGWYNATEIPYAVGLAQGDERLFGKKVREVEAKGTLKAVVAKHSANVYRLRQIGYPPEQEGKTKLPYRLEENARDEL
jgi:alpha-galactosidase